MENKKIIENLFDSLLLDLEKNHTKFTVNQRIKYSLKLIDELVEFSGERKDLLEKYLSIYLNLFEIYKSYYGSKDTINFLKSRKYLFLKEQSSNIELINNSLIELKIDLLNLILNKNTFSIKKISNNFSLVFNYYFA
jgi:hypothetical protein